MKGNEPQPPLLIKHGWICSCLCRQWRNPFPHFIGCTPISKIVHEIYLRQSRELKTCRLIWSGRCYFGLRYSITATLGVCNMSGIMWAISGHLESTWSRGRNGLEVVELASCGEKIVFLSVNVLNVKVGVISCLRSCVVTNWDCIFAQCKTRPHRFLMQWLI